MVDKDQKANLMNTSKNTNLKTDHGATMGKLGMAKTRRITKRPKGPNLLIIIKRDREHNSNSNRMKQICHIINRIQTICQKRKTKSK